MKSLLTALSFISFYSIITAQWSNNPAINTPICTDAFKQNDPRILDDGKGGAFIAWKDERNGLPDIYLQRVNKLGVPLWALDGINICNEACDQSTPNIISDMAGGVIVSWSDRRADPVNRDVYAQRVDSNGVVLWAVNGVAIANKPVREHNEKIASDGAGGAIVVWEQLDLDWDVWGQRVNASGVVQWAPGGVALCQTGGKRINPKLQKDGRGGAIVTWQDMRVGEYDIYAQRISKDGVLQWLNTAVPICTSASTQSNPKIDPSNSTGGAYITWADKRNGLDYDIYLQKVDSNGVIQFALNGISVCNALGSQSAPEILSNKVEGVILAWKDSRAGNTDIYAQRIDALGTVMWANNGVAVCNSSFNQINPNMCEDTLGGAIVTWQDSSSNGFNIKAQRINANGTLMWLTNGIDIGTATDTQKSPKNVPDGKGGSIFVWQDKRVGIYDIFAHHIYDNGTYVNTASLKEEVLTTVGVYPNPANELLHLQRNDWKYLSLINNLGELVYEAKEFNEFIDVSIFANGLYSLQVITNDGTVLHTKLDIQH
jgi:hypothetical protein